MGSLNPELRLLGCLCLNAAEVIKAARLSHPGIAQSFHDGRHEEIWMAAERLFDANELTSEPIIAINESVADFSESLGGVPYLASLMNMVQFWEEWEGWAEKVELGARNRRIATLSLVLGEAANVGDLDKMDKTIALITDANSAAIDPLNRLLDNRRFNPAITPPEAKPVYSIGDTVIATRGNLQNINALVKAGKSGFINAMLAAPMALAGSDCLGLVSKNPEGRALLHFDTEQSIQDHWYQVNRAMRRAMRETLPPWFLSYCLTGFDAAKARQSVWMMADRAAQEHGGIHAIIIDGTADLVTNVNEPAECNPFVADEHALAIKYDCAIVNVIHFNPGSEKMRGHLGSQFERKGETNLRIDKDGEVSEVWSEKQRRGPIPKGKGPRFAWSVEAGMHVSVAPGMSAKESAKVQAAVNLRDEIFSGRPSMRYSELEKAIREATGKSDGGAKNLFRDWGKFGVIEKTFGGQWKPKD